MSYTKEAFTAEPSAAPQSQPIMRGESVIDPYARSASRSSVLNKAIGQPDKVGSEAAVESGQTAESVTLSPGAAALARKEQKFRQEQLRLKEKEEEIKAKEAKIAKYEAMEAKIAKKDYSDLEGIVDYDEYTKHMLAKEASVDPHQQALKRLEDEITGIKKATEDNVSKQFEAAVNERRVAAAKLIETDPDLSAFKARVEKTMPDLKLQDAVTQHILDTWEHDSVELSVEEATKEVHAALKDKAKAWASLIEEPSAPTDEKKQLPPMKPNLKTLTNQVTAGDAKKPVKSLQHMNDSERWAEARRRAEEKLQKQAQ